MVRSIRNRKVREERVKGKERKHAELISLRGGSEMNFF